MAGFVQKHRINTHDKLATSIVLASEMQADDFVRHGQETAICALAALNNALVA